jgi:hypothetical protein
MLTAWLRVISEEMSIFGGIFMQHREGKQPVLQGARGRVDSGCFGLNLSSATHYLRELE